MALLFGYSSSSELGIRVLAVWARGQTRVGSDHFRSRPLAGGCHSLGRVVFLVVRDVDPSLRRIYGCLVTGQRQLDVFLRCASAEDKRHDHYLQWPRPLQIPCLTGPA